MIESEVPKISRPLHLGEVLNESAGAPGIWFPAIRAGTGVDVFTQRLCDGLNARGIRAQITWLPPRAEYLPWSVPRPPPPPWATVAHVNTWLHRRFVPQDMAIVATMHHSVHDAALAPYKTLVQSHYHQGWVRPMERWILQHADAVAAVSHYTARKTQEDFETRIPQVIYNGMPAPSAEVRTDRSPNKPFRLLYVGSWSRRKGVDLLAPIMQRLGDDFILRHTSRLRRGVRLPPNCIGLGRLNRHDLEEAYLDSDALLFPTRLEGFGQVALEAMAYGLPVISTRCSALPEVVEDGVSGLLCPLDDVESFAAAARSLARDNQLWQSMSRAALLRSQAESFGLDSMVAGYLRLYSAAAERFLEKVPRSGEYP